MTTARRRRSDPLAEAQRLVEQLLSRIGLLRPEHCRARQGAPKKLLKALKAKLGPVYDELVSAVENALGEDLKGIVDWDAGALGRYGAAFEAELEKILLDAVDAAIEAGLKDAGAFLGEPEIKWEKVDEGVLRNLEQSTINLCETTAAKVTGDIKGQLLESQRLGENMHQAMERIKKISSLSDYEVERICRTELAKAANAGRLQGYKGRVKKVRWVLGPAYKGGCGCGDLAGEYTVEEAMSLQMPLHPNCDCYWEAVVEEFVDEEAA